MKKNYYKVFCYIFLFCILNIILNSSIYSINNYTKKAIVIGSSSGMGRQVAKLLATKGKYTVGLVSRRLPLLQSLQKEITSKTYIKQIDVSKHEKAIEQLLELVSEMGGLDLIVISVSAVDDKEKITIDVDLTGYLCMAHVAEKIFEKQKHGHIVAISSIDGIRGNPVCPTYSATKSFLSTHLEAIRNKMIRKKLNNIYVTDIIPGWVETENFKKEDNPEISWMATTKKAANQIFDAIQKKKKKAYITKRWKLIAWLSAIMPDWIYNKVGKVGGLF